MASGDEGGKWNGNPEWQDPEPGIRNSEPSAQNTRTTAEVRGTRGAGEESESGQNAVHLIVAF